MGGTFSRLFVSARKTCPHMPSPRRRPTFQDLKYEPVLKVVLPERKKVSCPFDLVLSANLSSKVIIFSAMFSQGSPSRDIRRLLSSISSDASGYNILSPQSENKISLRTLKNTDTFYKRKEKKKKKRERGRREKSLATT